MGETILEVLLDESKWPAVSIGLGLLVPLLCLGRRRRSGYGLRADVLWALNLYFGTLLATMSFGHLLAVTLHLVRGTLQGSPALLYPLGLALFVPSVLLVRNAARYAADEVRWGRRLLAYNVFLGIALIASGPHNAPLALPALFNVAYQKQSNRFLGWGIVTASLALTGALLVGSIVFFVSGQSFEEFSAR